MRSPQFSAKTEYACIAMLELAKRHGDAAPVRLKEIAEAHDIPHRFLVQILLQLKGTGLVVSSRGAAGGYHLGRPPEQITLADIVGLIDRPSQPSRDDHSAMAEVIHAVWDQIRDTQKRILAETTLAELLRRANEGRALTYQI